MADFSKAKSGPGGLYPDGNVEVQWIRTEPLVGPFQLRNLFLFGINLVSNIKDPATGKAQVMTDEILKMYIDRAVARIETETGLDIFPNIIHEKQPFDHAEYMSFGYFRTERRPVSRVIQLSVCPSTNIDIFIVPPEWIETARLPQGQINILPMTAALGQGGFIPSMSAGGAVFLQILGNKSWLPSFWKIEYSSGFDDAQIPKVVNEVIGIDAAIEVLSSLGATYARSTSYSLGIDGMSQSVGTPGPQIFAQRIQELTARKEMLVKKIKSLFGLTLFSGNL